ncbi:MAG: hypothetical protein ACI9BD_001276 [Candidatus Marinamargulisbacteria bacterium]|jgi:hypothetical protein
MNAGGMGIRIVPVELGYRKKSLKEKHSGLAEFRSGKLAPNQKYTDPICAQGCLVVVTVQKKGRSRKVTHNHLSVLADPRQFVQDILIKKADPEKVLVSIFGGDCLDKLSVAFAASLDDCLADAGFDVYMRYVLQLNRSKQRVTIFNDKQSPGVIVEETYYGDESVTHSLFRF